MSTSLDKIVQEYHDLAHIVQVWPELPEHIKAAIRALIQTYNVEGKDNED